MAATPTLLSLAPARPQRHHAPRAGWTQFLYTKVINTTDPPACCCSSQWPASPLQGRRLGGGVTVGEQHYMGPGTAEHTGWKLPKGRHRRTDTRNQEHHTRRQEGNAELERAPGSPRPPRALFSRVFSGRQEGRWEEPGPGAKQRSCAATERSDFITAHPALCVCKLGTVNCTSQSCHEDQWD